MKSKIIFKILPFVRFIIDKIVERRENKYKNRKVPKSLAQLREDVLEELKGKNKKATE